VFGISSPDVIATGDRFKSLICPEDTAFRQQTLSLIYRGSESYELEYRVRCADGEHRLCQDQGSAEVSATGNLLTLRGVLRPLTDKKKNNGRLDFLANYDALTGQYNRNRLRESIDHALQYSQRNNVEGALLTIGIDKMTLVNQAFGHEVADSIIIAIGDRLDRCLRSSDVVGRFGGDKFGAILVNCPETELRIAAEKILDTARNTIVDTLSDPIHVTVSIGAVNFPMQDENRGQRHDQGRYCPARSRAAGPRLFHHI